MVATRVMADADRATLAESLAAIADAQGVYAATGAARLLSGALLAGAVWFLWKAWAATSSRTLPALAVLAASGAITAVSGASALWLAIIAPATAEAAAAGALDAPTEMAAVLRWLTGKLGFAAAGIGLAALAIRRPPPGDPIARLPVVTLAIGLSMQLIWVDAATVLHRITGTAFFAWLLVSGVALIRRSQARSS